MKLDHLKTVYADGGPFASAYVEVSRNATDSDRVVELAARAAADAVRDAGADEAVAERLQTSLGAATAEPAPVSRVVVASARGVLFESLTRVHRAQPVATWAALPDLAQWIGDAAATEPFVLARVGHEGGEVSTYAGMGVVRQANVGEASTYEHKVSGGAWSQANFQRSAEAVWARNAKEVAEEIDRQRQAGPQLILLAGDEVSVSMVRDELAAGDVVVIEGGGPNADGGDAALESQVNEVLRGRTIARGLDAVHELRDQMGRGESFAIGVNDVVDAFVRGQVDTLLIDPEATAAHEVDPAGFPGLAVGAGEPGPVRADLLLVAAAVQTDADVTIARSSTLGDAPVAALLRWNQEAEGSRPT